MRQVILHHAEEGGYWASCPSLHGCYSQGETFEETLANIKEAIELWIEDAIECGEEVPDDKLDRVVVVV